MSGVSSFALHRRWAVAAISASLLCGVVLLRGLTEPKNDFRFSIIGDRTGGATHQIYGRVWREVDLLHPDFVITVGDSIEGGNDERAPAEWAELQNLWRRYAHYPLYFTAGNHDLWNESSLKLYEAQTGRPTMYSFDYQEAHFTVLDNARTADLAPAQLDYLRRDLEANKDKRPKFVFFHRPFWLLPLKMRSGAFPLHEIVRQYGVDYVISGHGHQFVRLQRDGVIYMEVGSSGGQMRRGLARGEGFAQGWFYHHVWARVKGSKVEMTVKEIDGPFGGGRMFNANDWGDNGPTFEVKDPASKEDPQT
ncbi:MAG: hypothetical protein FJW40_06705 [Acidobacteria bacterium]|nr:hypothetical protein [Acidobacteriota bacterium]